jgi:hypothetical protein
MSGGVGVTVIGVDWWLPITFLPKINRFSCVTAPWAFNKRLL